MRGLGWVDRSERHILCTLFNQVKQNRRYLDEKRLFPTGHPRCPGLRSLGFHRLKLCKSKSLHKLRPQSPFCFNNRWLKPMSLSQYSYQQCVSSSCNAKFDLGKTLTSCPDCGNLLDIKYEWERFRIPKSLANFESLWTEKSPQRQSGVWKFHELLPFANLESCLTVGEGRTILQRADGLAPQVNMDPGCLYLQYEGQNPSGSFKDNGMAAALTHANIQGVKLVACASTGNTSASLAMFAATTGLFKAIIFVGSGKIAFGKLSQALDYGALTLQIDGDFDDAMAAVGDVCPQMNIYLVNSVNPFRLEGQKTIMLRVLEGLNWEVPDWIVVPGGNLGNSSSFGKMFAELKSLGLIDRIPRIAVINAQGASTLDNLVNEHGFKWDSGNFEIQKARDHFEELQNAGQYANTIASAIEINLPVNLSKCLRAIEVSDGLVRNVDDTEILNGKALVAKYGFGCEPASGASVAGVRLLREQGIIAPSDRVVCILTGNILKDPTATVGYHTDPEWREQKNIRSADHSNLPVPVANNIEQIIQAIKENGG